MLFVLPCNGESWSHVRNRHNRQRKSMSKKALVHGVVVALGMLAVSVAAQQPPTLDPNTADANKVMSVTLTSSTPEQSFSQMKMSTRDAGGTRSRVLVVRSKRKEKIRSSLVLVESPADVRNTGFLTLGEAAQSGGDKQWLYLPKLRRTSRVPNSGKSDPFLGSDFSYSDLTQPNADDYKWKMLETAVRVGDEDCWHVEGEPRNKDVLDATGYSKTEMWVSKAKQALVQLKAQTIKGGQTKYYKASDFRLTSGHWSPHRLQMRTLTGNTLESETLIEVLSMSTEKGSVSDTDFTLERLERGL
jgi:hypothetical protein